MRYNFNEIFKVNDDGSLSPTRQIMVGGLTFGPGVSLKAGTAVWGIDFHQYKDHDMEAKEKDGVLIIEALY